MPLTSYVSMSFSLGLKRWYKTLNRTSKDQSGLGPLSKWPRGDNTSSRDDFSPEFGERRNIWRELLSKAIFWLVEPCDVIENFPSNLRWLHVINREKRRVHRWYSSIWSTKIQVFFTIFKPEWQNSVFSVVLRTLIHYSQIISNLILTCSKKY